MNKIIMDRPYDYIALKNAVKELLEEYPFIHVETIGKAVSSKDIIAIKIGRADEYVLYAGAFHGSEHITESLLLKFTEQLCFALKSGSSLSGLDMRRVMMGRGLIIVPCVNPDGVEISLHGPSVSGYMANKVAALCLNNHKKWNANMRGVDINHNFDAGWQTLHELEQKSGIYGPAMTRYGGHKPTSEPETKAITDLCDTYPIRHALAFHSQGEVIYSGFDNIKVPRMQKMAEIMSSVSGYALDNPSGLAVGGGFKDWFIKKYRRPAFTVEVGLGENPLPSEDIAKIYSDLCEMLVLCLAM